MNWFHFDNCIGLCFISQKRESDNKRIWQGKETIIVAINSTLEWWQHKEETALFFEKCNSVRNGIRTHSQIRGPYPYHLTCKKSSHSLSWQTEIWIEGIIKLDVIEPINKPTEWVNPLVIVEKPNEKSRVCLDPRDLNKAIKRQHYKLPTAEELFSDMTSAHHFSKLDASNGYWQIKTDTGYLDSY